MELLKYYLKDYVTYRKERFSFKIYLPFALYLTIASFIGMPFLKVNIMFLNAVIILLLLFQFRLWDDLHSIQEDRMIYPQRILCNVISIKHYWFFLAILFIVCMGLIYYYSVTIIPITCYLLLILFYLIMYYLGAFNKGTISNHLTIMKYVIIVLIVMLMHNEVILIKNIYYPLISVFLVMSIYEVIHDGKKYENKSMRLIVIIESIMLILLNLSILVLNYSNTSLTIKLINVFVFVLGIIFLWYIVHYVKRIKVLKYVPHGISLLQFLIILYLKGV
jgi:hypothetical protein